MTFQPITNYAGFNHVPVAGAVWIHPGNGNAYCCACEKDAAKRQDLSVYRMRRGAAVWELVTRYEGTEDSANQITMGGAAIEQDGALLVVTSLIIPNVPKVTTEGFQGVWIREPHVDEPWSDRAGEPGQRPPVAIPVGGAIASLWPYPYSAAECDTAAELAVKLTKSNAAVLELVALLKQAGVLV
jgi:hypothetical protein